MTEKNSNTEKASTPEVDGRRPGGDVGGEQSPDAEQLPSHPTDSDSELGDTDQHSSA